MVFVVSVSPVIFSRALKMPTQLSLPLAPVGKVSLSEDIFENEAGERRKENGERRTEGGS
jgi:hypothetical protein